MHDAVDVLAVAHDGDGYVIGRPDLGIYIAVPEPGAVIVQRLQSGASLAEAAASASEVAGDTVDAEDFMDALADVGLLDPVPAPASGRGGGHAAWLDVVRPHQARVFFGPVAWCIYASAALFVVAIMAARADLRPRIDDVWFLADPVQSTVVLIPVMAAVACAHELWHWLAGRALGIGAVFRLSHRGLYLVFETELPDLVAVSRRRRWSPLLAGVALDLSVLAACLGLRLAYLSAWLPLPPWLDRFLAAVIFMQVLSVIWQLAAVALRSDAYAVLANALRCHNLYRATWLTVKARLWRLNRAESAELAATSSRDRGVASWFAAVYLAGLAAMWWTFVTMALPFALTMGVFVWQSISAFGWTELAFWESVAVLAYLVAAYGGPFILTARDRRRRMVRPA